MTAKSLKYMMSVGNKFHTPSAMTSYKYNQPSATNTVYTTLAGYNHRKEYQSINSLTQTNYTQTL